MSDKLRPCDHDECGPSKCRKADAIISAINATLNPYREHLTTATAMLFIGIFQDIEQLDLENNQLRADLKQCENALDNLKPETECPFCLENEPCGDCMEMARVAGQVAKALTSVQNALKGK